MALKSGPVQDTYKLIVENLCGQTTSDEQIIQFCDETTVFEAAAFKFTPADPVFIGDTVAIRAYITDGNYDATHYIQYKLQESTDNSNFVDVNSYADSGAPILGKIQLNGSTVI